MVLRPLFFVSLLPVCACAESDEDKDGSGTIEPVDDSGVPHGSAPEITNITFAQGEPTTLEDGTQLPTVLFQVDFEDDDGDAHVVSATIWADEVVDGAIDTSSTDVGQLPDTALTDSATGAPVDEGDGFLGQLTIQLAVSGGNLNFETLYEFGVVIYDSVDTASEPGITSGTTPAML